ARMASPRDGLSRDGRLLALDGTGHIYLAGGGKVANSPDYFSSLIVMKLDASGNELWRRTTPVSPVKSGNYVIPVSLAVDREGNCALVGWFDGSQGSALLKFGSVFIRSVGYS